MATPCRFSPCGTSFSTTARLWANRVITSPSTRVTGPPGFGHLLRSAGPPGARGLHDDLRRGLRARRQRVSRTQDPQACDEGRYSSIPAPPRRRICPITSTMLRATRGNLRERAITLASRSRAFQHQGGRCHLRKPPGCPRIARARRRALAQARFPERIRCECHRRDLARRHPARLSQQAPRQAARPSWTPAHPTMPP